VKQTIPRAASPSQAGKGDYFFLDEAGGCP
jgi:hypothetical protein